MRPLLTSPPLQLYAVALRAGLAGLAAILLLAVLGASPALAATAGNVWVSASGAYSGCARSATPTAYNAATDCSWAGAYTAAANGDTVVVRGGSYGNVTMPGTKTGAPAVTFASADGESVVVGDFQNGWVGDGATSGANNLTFIGPVTARQFRTDDTDNVTVDGWTVHGQDTVNQIMHFENTSHFTLRNSEVSNNRNTPLMYGSGDHVTIDHSKIHDAGLDAGSGAHTECFYANGIDDLRITGSHFYRCSVMDVFITRWSGTSTDPQRGWIENNVFEKPWSTTGVVGSGYAFHFRNGGEPAPDIYDWTFRNNTFLGPLSLGTASENIVQPSGLRVLENIFAAGAACRSTNSTYQDNIYAGSTCGGSGEISTTASALNTGFVGPTTQGNAGNNFRLNVGSPAIDRGNVASFPATDLDGALRYAGLKPDVGAFEYGVAGGSDVTAPETTIVSGVSGSTAVTDASFGFSSSEAGSTFQCRLDGGVWAACTSPKAYSAMGLGAHTFEVRATDTAGNVDASPASRTWTITSPADVTAPDTSISSGPAATTTSTSASLVFAASESATFQCRLDGSSWASCASPKAYSGLSVGAHTFEVRATDTAGNVDASPASHAWTITSPADVTAPDTSISSGPSGTTTSTSASLAFTASESATFQCRLDGGTWASCTSPKAYSGLSVGAHTFEVRATDTAGNVDASPASRTWTITSPSDVTAPETTIVSGVSGSTAVADASFAFSASEAGSTFECRLDGGSWASCASPEAYSGLGVGAHTFEVRATDAAGNVDASPASRTWTITAPADVTAPDTSISSGPAATTTSTSASLVFAASESATFQCRLDGSAWASCVSPKAYSALGLGAHTFEVRATDTAGNVDASPASHAWTITSAADVAAPDTTISSGPWGTTTSTFASLAFTASESATFQCRLDGSSWASCTSPKAYKSLSRGKHVFRVRAVDAAGNVDASPAERTWTIRRRGSFSFEVLSEWQGAETVSAESLEGVCAMMDKPNGKVAVRLHPTKIVRHRRSTTIRSRVPALAVDGSNARIRVSYKSSSGWRLLTSRRLRVRSGNRVVLRVPKRSGALRVTAVARCG